MSNAGGAPPGDVPAPVAGAGSAQEVVDEGQEGAQELAAAPLREDQIQNAVAFLGHPKVQGSAEDAKRSFLERKGLTAAEIAEAFRRAPAGPPAAAQPSTSAVATITNPYTSSAPASRLSAVAPTQHAGPLAAPQQLQPAPGIRWTQVALGVGIIGAGAYALKALLVPYLQTAYDRWAASVASNGRKLPEDDVAMADKLATAIQEQTAEMRATVASMQATVAALQTDELRATLGELRDKVQVLGPKGAGGGGGGDEGGLSKEDLRRELRSFATTLSEFSGPSVRADDISELQSDLAQVKQLLSSFCAGGGGAAASPARSGTESAGLHTPFASPGIGSSQQQHGPPGVAPYGANGYAQAPANGLANGQPLVHHTEPVADEGRAGQAEAFTPESMGQPPKPASYTEILEMLEQGKTPPGIRKDINDKPPDPSQAPSDARLQPRPKPWERAASGSGALSLPEGGAGPAGPQSPGAGSSAGGGEAGGSGGGGWRPPPVPQPSLRLARSTKSSAAGSTTSSVNGDA